MITEEQLQQWRELSASVKGCGDHGCALAKSRGMATNGGCQCIDKGRVSDNDTRREIRKVGALAKTVPALLDEVERLRRALKHVANFCVLQPAKAKEFVIQVLEGRIDP